MIKPRVLTEETDKAASLSDSRDPNANLTKAKPKNPRLPNEAMMTLRNIRFRSILVANPIIKIEATTRKRGIKFRSIYSKVSPLKIISDKSMTSNAGKPI